MKIKRLLLALVAIPFLLLVGVAKAQNPAQYNFTITANYQHNNLMHPTGLWLNETTGDLYIADTDHNQIKLFSNGTLSTIAGSGSAGYLDGDLLNAQFDRPTGVSGELLWWKVYCPYPNVCEYSPYTVIYINDSNNFVVRAICLGEMLPPDGLCNQESEGVVQTASGSHARALLDGPNPSAAFAEVGGLVPSYDITDSGNHAIRTWNLSTVTTYAGTGQQGFVNGFRTNALFNYPVKTARDGSGNRYVTDAGNSAIRKIDSAGNVTTLAGIGTRGYLNGPGYTAQFNIPTGMAHRSADNSLYVADTLNNCIRKVDAYGNVTTYAGSTSAGLVDGSLTAARFTWPTDIVISGNYMYVADTLNNVIRRIDMSAGTVTTLVN